MTTKSAATHRDHVHMHGNWRDHQDWEASENYTGRLRESGRGAHLDGEIDVARGVDDIDVGLLPPAVRGSGLDGDAFLPLQLHAVHLGAHPVLAPHLSARRVAPVSSLSVAQAPPTTWGCMRRRRCGASTSVHALNPARTRSRIQLCQIMRTLFRVQSRGSTLLAGSWPVSGPRRLPAYVHQYVSRTLPSLPSSSKHSALTQYKEFHAMERAAQPYLSDASS